MTSAPADLLGLRAGMSSVTGLTNPNNLGIVGDGAHQRTGGYHEGRDVLTANGMFHPPATSHVGSGTEDYSCRLQRDRTGLTNSASAFDLGNAWPKGGNAAWLRYNNLLAARLRAGDPSLSAIRAINYSPDGNARYRIDRENFWKQESSSDTVTVHTHHEFYRDTEGNRQVTLNALVALAQTAITNPSAPPATLTGDDDMKFLATDGTNFYLCDLQTSELIDAATAAGKAYLAFSAYSQTPGQGSGALGRGTVPQPATPEWGNLPGYPSAVRLGWGPAFGRLVNPGAPVTIDMTDADIAQLAAAIHVSTGASLDDIKALLNGAHLVTT